MWLGGCTSNNNKPWRVTYVAQICWQMLSPFYLEANCSNKKSAASSMESLHKKQGVSLLKLVNMNENNIYIYIDISFKNLQRLGQLSNWPTSEAWTWFLQSWLHLWLPLHLAYCWPRWPPSTTSAFRTTFGGTNNAKSGHCCSIRLASKRIKVYFCWWVETCGIGYLSGCVSATTYLC